MTNSDTETETDTLDLFTEPADYYPPSPKPTTETHILKTGETLTLHLVGHNPLWGHHLWNAGRIISNYLEENPTLISNKTVLELGAGAGLPSLTCASLGAKKVVVTDYPDGDLIQNLWENIGVFYKQFPGLRSGDGRTQSLVAEGYCWGADASPLLSLLPPSEQEQGFDILILADLLFNHSEHGKLLDTVKKTLKRNKDSKALVFFTPYRPWLLEKDLAFFDLVRNEGMGVEKVLEVMMEKVMFEKDMGDEKLRRTVFGYVVTWGEGDR